MEASIEKYLVLINAAKGKVDGAVHQALKDRKVFVFGELLDCLEAKEGVSAKVLDTMRLFAYGVYGDYKADQGKYMELNEKELQKLKQLSLVTMAASQPTLSYATIQSQLDVGSTADVEELTTSCIYSGLMQARIDQKRQVVDVATCAGRDVQLGAIDGLIAKLEQWQARSQEVVSQLEQHRRLAGLRKGQEEEEDGRIMARIIRSAQRVQEDEGRRLAAMAGGGMMGGLMAMMGGGGMMRGMLGRRPGGGGGGGGGPRRGH